MDLAEVRIDECFKEILRGEAVREDRKGVIQEGRKPLVKWRELKTRKHISQNTIKDLRAAPCRIAPHCE